MSESKVVIPDEAVEAAARVMNPAVWGPQVWTFTAHGETPTDARNRVQQEALQEARAALASAAPHLMAAAWDEGVVAGAEHQHHIEIAKREGGEWPPNIFNPYKERS